MILKLTRLPSANVIGIYGKNENTLDDAKEYRRSGDRGKELDCYRALVVNTMPERMRALHPDAAVDYLRGSADIIVSDMFRSPESSLHVSQIPGRNALPPSQSGHNFGFSIDVHTTAMRSRLGLKSKAELDEWMAQWNFYNFWVDGQGSHRTEDWHYNHFPAMFRDKDGGFSTEVTTGYLENMIGVRYGSAFKLSDRECQAALARLDFYDGAVDGKIGRLSKMAIEKFQAAWMPKHRSGVLDIKTERLLAYLTAEIEWVPLPAEMPAAA